MTRPRLIVTATPSLRTPSERQVVRSAVDRLLGLRIDLSDWYRMAEEHQRLRRLADQFRGVKPPRFPTVFETLVNAFACQQLSLVVGLELLNRLAKACDVRRGTGERANYAFPTPRDVARIAASRYHAIGFSRQKVHALLTLARRIDRGEIDVERLALEDGQRALAQLRELRGVGRWTAEYRTATRSWPSAYLPGRRCRGAEESGSVARPVRPSGLRRRRQGRREVAAVCGHAVFPSPPRRPVEGRRYLKSLALTQRAKWHE